MSLRILTTAAAVEWSDEFNEARLLLLLLAAAGPGEKPQPLEGAIKLAKMDFLLRYPNILERALRAVAPENPGARQAIAAIPPEDKDTIEVHMIRFRYGPYDLRYPRWLSILVAKQLVYVYSHRNTVKIQLTTKGKSVAETLAQTQEFKPLAERAESVRLVVGDMPSTKVADFIYHIAPELNGLKMGEPIVL
jgi:hypothetical protein